MSIRNFVLLTACAFVILWIFIPTGGYGYDVECFKAWTVFVHQHPLSQAYELPGLDYNPLFIELLWLFGIRQGSTERIQASFFGFKLVVLLFDLGGVYLAAGLLRLNRRNVALACFILFNIAYLYNTLFWGQVDSIFTFFVALSIFFATREKVLLSLLSALVAVNFKIIAVCFGPLILLLNMPRILKDRWALPRAVVAALVVQLLILLPYLTPSRLAAIVAVNRIQLNASASLSPSGYNFWRLVAPDQSSVPAVTTALGITLKTWGVVMFLIAAGVVLMPLFRATLLRKRTVSDAYVFLVSGLYGLAFFFFTTGMHERYSHPALLLLGIHAVLSGSYFLYCGVSVAYILNMEKGFGYLHLNSYDTLIFDVKVIAFLFLVVLWMGTFKVYREQNTAIA